MIKICKYCKVEFDTKREEQIYCSVKCVNKCPEHAKKISKGRKAFLKTSEGKRVHRAAMEKRSKLPYYQQRGTKRERKRDAEYGRSKYRKWRISVLRRDGFTCQQCGKIGGILQAHHIKSWKDYPEVRYDIENGITVCLKCHKDIHGFETLDPKKCKICNKSFDPHRIEQRFCSVKCVGKNKSIESRKNNRRYCEACNKEFYGYSHRRFCSHTCYSKSLETISNRPCKYCGKIFKPHMKDRKFCSRKCYGLHTTEISKKICPVCLEKFSPKKRKQVCCSRYCADIKRRKN